MIKTSTHQEDMIINLYAPNVRVPKFIKQTLLDTEGEIGFNTIIIWIPYPHQQKDHWDKITNKETSNYTIDQTDLIDICGTFHPRCAEFMFFSSTHGTFPRIDHTLGHTS
jgi:hypothetical protein